MENGKDVLNIFPQGLKEKAPSLADRMTENDNLHGSESYGQRKS